jgi:hypothetical protein
MDWPGLRAAGNRTTVAGETWLAADLVGWLAVETMEQHLSKPPPDMDPEKAQVPAYENRNDVPTLYFDIAPAYGVMSGIVQVELGARILVPHQDDSVDVRFVSCGRLRCSAAAAVHLRNALDASLKMLEQPQPNPVGVSKLIE